MASVDEQVVKMRFDNSQFEQGANKSIGTLDRLKQALKMDGASKGFEDLNRSINDMRLDNIAAGVEALEKKFSALGIAGMTVIANLTNGLVNSAKQTVSTIERLTLTGGENRALNIEQARFMFKGLKMDAEGAMTAAKNAVSGTAYGLDEAAKAAAQFGAAGMKAGSEMETALQAIAGVAAMTGSGFTDIANIFTTVSANGRLMGDQLQQLSVRGLSALSTLAKSLNKSEAEVKDMVSKGKVSFEDFYKAMYDAFGKHAKAANKTFTGSLSNTKAALSRLSADMFIAYHEAARKVLLSVTAVFDNIKKSMKNFDPSFEFFVKRVGKNLRKYIDPMGEKSKDLTRVFNALGKLLKAVAFVSDDFFRAIAQIGKAFASLSNRVGFTTQAFRDLAQSIKIAAKRFKPSAEDFLALRKVFYSFMRIGYDVARVFLAIARSVGGAFAATQPLLSSFSDFAFKSLIQAKNIFNSITATLDRFFSSVPFVNLLASGITAVLSVAQPAIATILALGEVFKQLLKIIEPIALTITQGVAEGIEQLGQQLANVLGRVQSFVEGLAISDEMVERLKGALVPVVELLKIFFEIAKGIGRTAFTVLSGGLDILSQAFEHFTGQSGPFIDNFLDWMTQLGINLQDADFPTQVRELFDAFNEELANGMPSFQNIVDGVKNGFANIRDRLAKGESIFSIVGGMFDSFSDKLQPLRDFASKVGDIFKNLLDNIGIQIPSIDDIVGMFPSEIQEKLQPLVDIVKKIGDGLKELVTNIAEAFKPAGDAVGASVDNVVSKMDPLTAVFNFFKEVFFTIVDGLGNIVSSFSWIGDAFRETFAGIGDVFGNAIDDMDYETFLDAFNSGMFAGLVVTLKKFVDSFTNITSGLDTEKLSEKITGLMDSVGDTLAAFQGKLKADTLKTIAISIAILAGSLTLLAFLNPQALAKGLMGITVLFMGLERVFASLAKTIKAGGIGVIKDVAVMFLGLSASVLLLAFSVKLLGSLGWKELLTGLGAVTVLIAELYFLGNKGGIQHMYISTAEAMIKFGVALGLMAISIKMLSSIPIENLLSGLGGMAAAMAMLSAFAMIMEKTKMDDSLGKSMVSLGASLIVLAIGLKALSLLQADEIIRSLAAMAGALLLMSAAAIAMNKFSSPEAATGFLAMAAAILILAPALLMLSTMSIEGILTALGALAGTILILVAGGALVEAFSAGILGLSMAMFTIGSSFLMAGAGAALFGASLVLIAAAGLPAVAVILALLGGIIALIPALAASLAGAIVAIIAAIGDSAQAIATAVLQIIAAVAVVIMGAIPIFIAVILNIIDSILAALQAHMPSIMENGFKLAIMFAQGVQIGLPILIDQGVQMIISFINGLATALDEHKEELAQAIARLAASLIGALGQAVVGAVLGVMGGMAQGFVGLMQLVGNMFLDFGQNVGNWIIDILGSILGLSPEAIEAAKEFFGKFIDTAREVIMNLPDILAGGINDALGFFGIPPIFEEKGDEAGMELASGITESDAPEEALEDKMDSLGEGIDFSGLTDLGGDGMASIAEGMEGTDIDFGSLISSDLMEGVQDGESTLPDFKNLGFDGVDNISAGMEDSTDLGSVLEGLMGDAKADGTAKAKEFDEVGDQAVNGAAQGVRNNHDFSDAIRQMVRDGLAAGKDEAKVKSPSRLFRDELGVFIPAGIAKGVDKASYLLEAATKNSVDQSLNAAKTSLGKFDEVLNADLDMDPTIRPVLDLSNIEAGSKTISQMLEQNPTYGVAQGIDTSGLNAQAADISLRLARAQAATEDFSDVVNAIGKLGTTLESLDTGDKYIMGDMTVSDTSSVANAMNTIAHELMIDGRS